MADVQFDLKGMTHFGSPYVTDSNWRAYRTEIGVDGDCIAIDGVRGGSLSLFLTVDVEGFGRTCLPADGDGAGLPPTGRYSLALELLRSRAARCRALAATAKAPEWDAIQDEVVRTLDAGDAAGGSRLLGPTIIAAEELLHQHQLQRGGGFNAIVSATLFGERRGNWSIGVGPDWDADAPPDFTRDPLSRELAVEAIGGTTLPNFWRYLEFEQGRYRWDRIDAILEQARSAGLTVKSFALYWGGIGGCPPWFRTLKYPDQLKAIERWVRAVVHRYRGEIACWETVNEMHNWSFGNPFSWSHAQLLEVTGLVNELVGSLDPGTPRLINNCCIWGDYIQQGAGPTWSDASWKPDWTPLAYLDAVHERAIPFDAIGLQYYNPGRDIQTCHETLGKFAAFGKPVQVTEMGTPSAPAGASAVETGQVDPMSGWRGVWTPERQALWLDRFFNIFGREPGVDALNYWDFDDAQAFIEHAGVLDRDYQPKPSYEVLVGLAKQ